MVKTLDPLNSIPFEWPGNRLRFNFLKMAENKSWSHCVCFIDPFHSTQTPYNNFIHLFDWPLERTAFIYIEIPRNTLKPRFCFAVFCSAQFGLHKFYGDGGSNGNQIDCECVSMQGCHVHSVEPSENLFTTERSDNANDRWRNGGLILKMIYSFWAAFVQSTN